jgi:hypothetical protein
MPPIDDLPPPPGRKTSSIDDLPPPPKKESPGAVRSFTEKLADAATLGYMPHIKAGSEQLAYKIHDKLYGTEYANQMPSYVESRDEHISELDQMAKEHPYASAAGTAVGTIGAALSAGGAGAAAKGATATERLKAARNAGVALGALSNPGDVAGEVDTTLQLGDRTTNAVIGGVAGMGGQIAAEAVGAGSQVASKYLRDKAAKSATRALGRPTPTMAKKMAESGDDIAIGRELLEQKAIPVFGTSGRIAKRVDALRDKSWQNVERLLGSGGDDAVVDGAEAGMRILNSEEIALLREAGETQSVKALEDAAEQLAGMGKVSLKKAQQIKKTIDAKINYEKANPTSGTSQEGRFAKRTALRDQMDQAVTDQGGGKGELKSAFKKQGMFEKAADIVDREAGRTQANSKVSLTDVIAGGAGFSYGESPEERAAWGFVLGALNKGRRAVGPAMYARSADGLGKLLSKTPKFAKMAEENPKGFAALLERMSSKLQDTRQPIPQFAEQDSNRSPAKGYDKWARDGATRLGLSDRATERLMQSQKGKDLLSQASDLPLSSPELKKIHEQIQKGWGVK